MNKDQIKLALITPFLFPVLLWVTSSGTFVKRVTSTAKEIRAMWKELSKRGHPYV